MEVIKMASFISKSLTVTEILNLQNTSISAESGQKLVLAEQDVVIDSIDEFLPDIKERDEFK